MITGESNPEVSSTDAEHYAKIRWSVSNLLAEAATHLPDDGRILDVAPQDHGGVAPFLTGSIEVVTIDLDASSSATIIGDICEYNPSLADGYFDVVVCTEVLEHVTDPFSAIAEMRRVLRTGGYLFCSSPFDFRIHGPLPDNWRFTEHGWRILLRDFEQVDIRPLANPNRFLMPIHYTVVCVK